MLPSDLERVALRLLKALDIPEAQEIALLIKHKRWDQLVKTKFDPLQHASRTLSEFRRICLAQEFLRKADFLDTSIDRGQVARDAFLSCEHQCKLTNDHLDKFLWHPVVSTALEQRYQELLILAQQWVKATLGPVPETLDGSFGPGAVFESKDWRLKKFTAYDKLRNTPFRTSNMPNRLASHLIHETAYRYAWGQEGYLNFFPTVRGNRFTTVPKDATKDRGIAIEPGINVLGQKAVGKSIRARLLRRGIDLRGDYEQKRLGRLFNVRTPGLDVSAPLMGQTLHRNLAKEASKNGLHGTVDLSNASDTVCYNLVKLLLPGDWFTLLSDLRSPYTLFSPDGKKKKERWYRLEKFSSMGNGFTFELETLIFCALAHAVNCQVGVDTFVYGDDMIVPIDKMADVLAILRYSGFTPNKTKTFGSESAFRESCGGDFLNGHDVRPFYIKESPDGPEDWIALANSLWHWSIKWSMPELMAVRASVLDKIPTAIRQCRGPSELGDLVICDEERLWNTRTRGSIRYLKVWRPVQRKNYLFRKTQIYMDFTNGDPEIWVREETELSETGVAYAAALIGLPADGIAPRNSVEGYRFGRIKYS